MAKFKVYYTIELNEVATHIFESNDFEVKLCSHNDEETYVKELAEFQPDAIMCRTEPITAKMMDTCKNLKVIGKQGRIAKAIRAVVRAATAKDQKPVFVEIQ
mgnify:FL=1